MENKKQEVLLRVDGLRQYFGPTKAQVTLVLPFTIKYKKGGRP